MADLELNSIGNGDGNNYLLRDNSKIPLSGSNQISGDLVPATDNSIDVGSSTKNLKMLYTKGITIGGTQFLPSDYATLSSLSTVATSGSYNDLSNKPTIPSKTSDLTNDSNFISSAIKEGNFGNSMAGWCLLYGDLLIQWGSNTSSSRNIRINFTKPFSYTPTIVANYGDNVNYSTTCAVHDVQTTYFNAAHSNDGGWRVNWIAIGRA